MLGEIEKTIISVVLAYIVSQTIKYFVEKRQSRRISIINLFTRNSGMPSTHTSTTIALTTSLVIYTGISYFSVISGLFTLIVMNDATHVRRETGELAKLVNKTVVKFNLKARPLAEQVGHTPFQVLVGLVVGLLCAYMIFLA